jgi:Arc/MetJ-type ribon-helix-helix transcriptional regulator
VAKIKRSVSLDDDLVAEAEQLGRYASLSEAANAGLRVVVAQARLEQLVTEHEQRHGRVPDELVEEVKRWLLG